MHGGVRFKRRSRLLRSHNGASPALSSSVRHRHIWGSRSRRLYHRFLERTIIHVPISILLQRGYTVKEIVSCAPTRPDER